MYLDDDVDPVEAGSFESSPAAGLVARVRGMMSEAAVVLLKWCW